MAKEKTEVAKNDMETFEWDSSESTDFFGQKEEVDTPVLTKEEKEAIRLAKETSEEEETEEVIEEVVDKKKKSKKKEVTEEEEEEEVEFFETTEEVIETEKNDVGDDIFKVLATDFKKRGILNFENEIEGDLDEEGFTELYENEIENRIQETFEGFFEEMDEDAKSFLKFKKDGGKTSDFFNMLQTTVGMPKGNIEDEDHQKRVAEYYFKTVEKVDDEDIADKIEWLEENGKLDKYAKKYDKKLQDLETTQKDSVIKQQEAAAKQAEKDAAEFQKEVRESLNKMDSVKDLPLSAKDKSELLTFITKPSVKVGKNKFITEFQAGLQKVSSNYEGLIALAKLIKSDFDFSSIKTKVATKQTQELKENLRRSKSNKKPNSSGSSVGKQLSDFF